MRILVISDLPHFVTGGAEVQAARLIAAWLDAGHEVICLGRRMHSGNVDLGSHSIIVHRIRTLSVLGRWGRAASYACSLAWLLMRYRRWADVVYTRFLGEAATVAAIFKRFGWLHAVLVATPANVGGAGDLAFLRSIPMHSRLIRLLDERCDAINLIAAGLDEELTEAGFSGRNFSRIPNGIPTSELHTSPPSGAPGFVAVGRLAPQKGYDILLRALSAVKHELGHARLRIVGDGPERDGLVGLAKSLGVDKHVDWLGELSQAQVREELHRAQLFLLPSRYEGLSNAGLEAMERGLPLILTRCGGLDRYVGDDCGWVVPPEDAVALAEALSAALTAGPDALAAMGARARSLVENQFDMNVVAERYLQLFKRLRKASRAPTV